MLRGYSFASYMTMAVIVSYFPLYFKSLGYSTIQIGLLYSVGPMIGIISNIFWGLMSDKYRTVKNILIVVLLGQWIFAFFVFQSTSFVLLLLLMAAFFFFQSPNNSLTDSLTLLSIQGTNKSYASFRVWGSIGFAIASLSFGMILKQYGAGLTVYLCLGTIAFSFIVSTQLTDGRRSSTKKLEFSGLVQVVRSKRFLAFMFIVLVSSVSHRFNDGFLALFLNQLGADQSIVGLSWLVSALSEVPIFFLLSKYGHRYKELPLLMISCFVYVIRFTLMSQVENPLWVIAIQAMHSISFGIFLFTVIRYIARIIPDQYRATGQAILAVTWSGIAGLLSGTLGGWLFRDFGPHTMYGVGALLSASALLGFLLLHLFAKESE
ncbi:MFS transporter [Paenibacillus agricola]|uniref:MFS transporter n=1 Tax=Paenibacillus agricola TaxID=2716264 RepID=A0ABX0J8T9_9BACL|nr:MFS transporter [Paenibacillus agricola]NHN31272.1 MFS transporter [Paenibacillus agricola]